MNNKGEVKQESDREEKCISEDILDYIESKEEITIKPKNFKKLLEAYEILKETQEPDKGSDEEDND
jgi:hypothetical protein